MTLIAHGRVKLLFVCGSLAGGGAEKILVYLLNHLDKARYESRLLILARQLDYLPEIDKTVKIDCLDKTSRWGFFKLVRGVGRVLREYQPEVVVSLLNHVNIITMLAKIYSRSESRAILCEHLHLHNYFMENLWGRLKKLLMKMTFGKADTIVAVSAGIKKCLEEEYGMAPERTRIIYNPIPIDQIAECSRAAVDHAFFRDKKLKVIISAGRLVRQKRFDRMLTAFARAKEKQADLRLLILGKGELEQELQEIARKLRIDREVDFVGFQDNPYAWMAKADMFAMSSEREGFPNVLIEAMACGIPIISTDCLSGPSEIIDNYKNGILVPENDLEALAGAFLTLASGEDMRKRFSAAGKAFAGDFRVEKILPQYEKLFYSSEGRR